MNTPSVSSSSTRCLGWLLNFIVVNGALLLLALCELFFCTYTSNNVMALFAMCVVKNALMVAAVDRQVRSRPYLDADKRVEPTEKYRGEFAVHLVRASFAEACTKVIIHSTLVAGHTDGGVQAAAEDLLSRQMLCDWLWLVPRSFAFEVVFDFFHYWAHRLVHAVPLLYRRVHKTHHRFAYTTSIIAFYQDPLDLVLSNVFPTLAALTIVAPFVTLSQWTVVMMLTYKTHIEICGHTGKCVGNTPSFHQCIWLPRALGIELLTEQHHKHHTLNTCNYAKRFALWDKVFGTFKA